MIKLVTVIGHGTNLIEHHIKHYSKYVDEIQYVVYETDLHPTLLEDVKKITKPYGNVKIVKTINERIFDWEKVTELYNEIKLTKPNDWWVIADIDEFHLYPENSLNLLISDCNKNGWEIVRGGFIDRIGRGGEFSELVVNKSIWEQFPNAGFFRYPMSKACPNKICVVKGYHEITSGQHYAKINDHTTWRWQGWNHPLIAPINTHSVQVHHFKWDSTSIERILNVSNVNKEYAFSSEYFLMYDELKKTNFTIDLMNPNFMFELGLVKPEFILYGNWNKLINKITSI
jgi:hypothetical protein